MSTDFLNEGLVPPELTRIYSVRWLGETIAVLIALAQDVPDQRVGTQHSAVLHDHVLKVTLRERDAFDVYFDATFSRVTGIDNVIIG